MEYESDSNTHRSRSPLNSPLEPEKRFDELEIKGSSEAIQTTALLKSARILKRILARDLVPL